MTYLKPPKLTQHLFNRLAMRSGMYGCQTLVVPGRASGEAQEIPVIPVEVDGKRYVVSTRGESQWVRNARTAGRVELRTRAGTTQHTVTEVPVADRPKVIEVYREAAGRTVTAYWRKLPDPADHPVFQLG